MGFDFNWRKILGALGFELLLQLPGFTVRILDVFVIVFTIQFFRYVVSSTFIRNLTALVLSDVSQPSRKSICAMQK